MGALSSRFICFSKNGEVSIIFSCGNGTKKKGADGRQVVFLGIDKGIYFYPFCIIFYESICHSWFGSGNRLKYISNYTNCKRMDLGPREYAICMKSRGLIGYQ